MTKEKLVLFVKGFIILLLILAIGIVSLLYFKSDTLLRQITNSLQHQLKDSLVYQDASLDWLSHFPSTSIHLDDLRIGQPEKPLIKGKSLDLIIPIFSLLSGNPKIESLLIQNAVVHIEPYKGKWTFDILKPKGKATDDEDSSSVTDIQQVIFKNASIHYKDEENNAVHTFLKEAFLSGKIRSDQFEIHWKSKGTLLETKLPFLHLPYEIPLDHAGIYMYSNETHSFKKIKLQNPGFEITGSVNLQPVDGGSRIELTSTFENSSLDSLAAILPEEILAQIKNYGLKGIAEGNFQMQGTMNENTTPSINADFKIDPLSLQHVSMKEKLGGIQAVIQYSQNQTNKNDPDKLNITLKKSGMQVNLAISNTSNPIIDLTARGKIPAPLVNLADISNLVITGGEFLAENFSIRNLSSSGASNFTHWLLQTEGDISIQGFSCLYAGKKIECSKGKISNRTSKAFTLQLDDFTWDNASVQDIDVELSPISGGYNFTLTGKSCEGNISGTGQLNGIPTRPVMESKWIAQGVEIRKIMSSMNDFGQSFITQKNISGKARVYIQATIPFNEKWQIREKDIHAYTALEILDGRLQNLSTLEDFGKYIHIYDLRDIKFQQLRNYLEIKNGVIYIPVMFIQSSAINLSISGKHTFEQHIHYDIKVNAGQTLANKVKKRDIFQSLKPARKSGWINLYYTLDGTTSNVIYQQDRKKVISNFEVSANEKESLRKKMVEFFGYDVYWLEPNEWEEIPEYR